MERAQESTDPSVAARFEHRPHKALVDYDRRPARLPDDGVARRAGRILLPHLLVSPIRFSCCCDVVFVARALESDAGNSGIFHRAARESSFTCPARVRGVSLWLGWSRSVETIGYANPLAEEDHHYDEHEENRRGHRGGARRCLVGSPEFGPGCGL